MAASSAPQVALLCCSLRDGELAMLAPATGPRSALPQSALSATQDPDAAAEALARRLLGRLPAWQSQVGALREGSALLLLYVAVLPVGSEAPSGFAWQPLARGAGRVTRAALTHLRERLDRDPLAFRLLGPTFTLSDLQRVYELLLERRLHKASFRRALLAAHLVEPTEEWRSEGRGRPAQLFRYSPRRRRGVQRAVRFELLG
jgi:ADP-ribose pyrophosphatase YjhB (NUDIX family)